MPSRATGLDHAAALAGEKLPTRSWLADFRSAVQQCVRHGGGGALKQMLTEQNLWALFQYRIEAAVYRSEWPAWIKKPLRLVLTVWHKLIELMTGVSLPCTASVGPGLFLPHCGSRVISGHSVIGANCCILQGATIGISGRGTNRGVPRIGDRVYLGANAVVVGKIMVGDDALIGANSLVNRDVPPHRTVVGVPAVVVSDRGSEDYL